MISSGSEVTMTSLPPPPEDECDCGDDFSPPGGDFFQCDDGWGGDDGRGNISLGSRVSSTYSSLIILKISILFRVGDNSH